VYVAAVRTTSALMMILAACGSKHDAPATTTAPSPVESQPNAIEPKAPPGAAESDDPNAAAYARMTRGSIPGDQLAPYVPERIGGVAISNPLPGAWAASAAYQLPDGGYANLDIKNTFIRATGDDSLVKLNLDSPKLCPTKQNVAGTMACVRVDRDRTTIFWYLPDRLTVTLSAPTEALTRKMALDLRIAELAKLSAQHTDGQRK
jgi:hypothetical protein